MPYLFKFQCFVVPIKKQNVMQNNEKYVSILSKIWDEHFGQSNVHYKITIYPDIKGKFAAVQVKLSFTSQIEDILLLIMLMKMSVY